MTQQRESIFIYQNYIHVNVHRRKIERINIPLNKIEKKKFKITLVKK